jgi:hypothetical protein
VAGKSSSENLTVARSRKVMYSTARSLGESSFQLLVVRVISDRRSFKGKVELHDRMDETGGGFREILIEPML